jgi:hypothetical protein
MMKKLLPQANSFETIVRVFLFAGIKERYIKDDIAEFCNFDRRQADYYLGACMYVGLFDEDGLLTSVGRDIIENDRAHCRERLYELVITDELAGKFFAKMATTKHYDINRIREYAANLTKDRYNYSDAVINRRSSAMVGWCEEILEYVRANR